jgi:hypothetical protein
MSPDSSICLIPGNNGLTLPEFVSGRVNSETLSGIKEAVPEWDICRGLVVQRSEPVSQKTGCLLLLRQRSASCGHTTREKRRSQSQFVCQVCG